MPRSRGDFPGEYNSPRLVPVIACLGIGQYLTIDMAAIGLKPETICAYVEQAARTLNITTRSHRDGETLYVGRFRNPVVDDMRLSGAEKRQRIETIRELAGTMSNWEIADRLGITPTNLTYIASTNKISLKYFDKRDTWTPERDEALVGYVMQGMPSKEIGKLLGISRGAVDMRLARLRANKPDLPQRQPGGYRHGAQWNDDDRSILCDLWNRGFTTQAIHAALGHRFSWDSIRKQVQFLRSKGIELAYRAKGAA